MGDQKFLERQRQRLEHLVAEKKGNLRDDQVILASQHLDQAILLYYHHHFIMSKKETAGYA